MSGDFSESPDLEPTEIPKTVFHQIGMQFETWDANK